MLLVERFRNLDKEEHLLHDYNEYAKGTVGDWTSVTTKSVSLSYEAIVYVRADVISSNADTEGGLRILVGDKPIACALPVSNTQKKCEVMVKLSAGSYNFYFQLALWKKSTDGLIKITYITITKFDFTDMSYDNVQGSLVSCPANDETEIYNQNFNLPLSRKTIIGKTKKAHFVCFIYVWAEQRKQKLVGLGESSGSDRINYKVYINDEQVNWVEKAGEDYGSGDNLSYGAGVYGLIYGTADISETQETVNIKIVADNKADLMDVRANVVFMACPWWIPPTPAAEANFDLSRLPLGCTIYIIAEPIKCDSTVAFYIGKFKFFYTNNDWYYKGESSTGIYEFEYTFEKINPNDVGLHWQNIDVTDHPSRGISFIMVDVR